MAEPLAFAGLRVLDASQGFAGPYAAMLLAQHGADVIKLEPPAGDWSRDIGKRYGDQTALSLAANRGKRSLAIDLKQPGGVAAVERLAAACDVVIESFRPGVAARLGLDEAVLRAKNPGLIYASVSGYGQQGPYRERPGTDMVIQAFSGMMMLNRDATGRPQRVGFLVVDALTGLYAFESISAALYARLAGGGGRKLDVSLLQSTAAFIGLKLIEASLEGDAPLPLNVPAGVYRTRDGWITVTLSKEAHFGGLCRAIERTDLLDDPRLGSFESRAAHAKEVIDAVAAEFVKRDSAQWIARIEREGGLVNPVNTPRQWLADPHVAATRGVDAVAHDPVGGFAWPNIPGVTPPEAQGSRGRWPGIGEHGAALLADAGFSEAEIACLRDARILIEPGCPRSCAPSTV